MKKNKNKKNTTKQLSLDPGLKLNAAADRDHIERYLACRLHPFDRRAEGARYLDEFSYPTATSKVEGVFYLTTNASGQAACCITPDILLTFFCTTGTLTSNAAYGLATGVYAATRHTQLANLYSMYRVVGGGIQVRNVQQPVSTQGSLFMAKTSSNGNTLSNDAITAVASQLTPSSLLRYTSSMLNIDTRILNLPYSTETTLQDVIQHHSSASFQVCSPAAYMFRPADDFSGLGGACNKGVPTFNGATQVAMDSQSNMSGLDNILIYVAGAPASTMVVEVKYCFHVEGVVAITANDGIIVPDGSALSPNMPRTMDLIDKSSQIAHRSESWLDSSVRTVEKLSAGVTKVLGFASKVGETVAHVAPLIAALL